MSEKNICMKCKTAGAKSIIRYKIIEDVDGQSVKFIGQLCEKCFNDFMAPAPTTDNKDDKNDNQEKG